MATPTIQQTTMKWYNYLAAFFAGAFLTNVIPNFFKGLSGSPFPTPFASPPGEGLSSPVVNVMWALINLLVGYLLFRASKLNSRTKLGLVVFFLGIILISINLSTHFGKVMAQ